MDFLEDLLFAVVGFAAGFLWNKNSKKEEPVGMEPVPEEEPEFDQMTLRNGYGVTRAEKPTFAEQFVNILNYNGENQKEENYEENAENHTAENLE